MLIFLMADDFEVMRIHAEREATGVIAVLAWLNCVPADGITGEPVCPHGPTLHLEGAVPFAIALPARAGAGPKPATVRQLVDEAHEALDIGLVERHAASHAGRRASCPGS